MIDSPPKKNDDAIQSSTMEVVSAPTAANGGNPSPSMVDSAPVSEEEPELIASNDSSLTSVPRTKRRPRLWSLGEHTSESLVSPPNSNTTALDVPNVGANSRRSSIATLRAVYARLHRLYLSGRPVMFS